MKTKWMLIQACALSSLIASPSFGQRVAESSGPITWISPPPFVRLNELQSNVEIFAFEEQQSVVLSRPLNVDIADSTIYTVSNAPASGKQSIPAGTMINSYFFHLDPDQLSTVTISGTVDFNERILGVIIYFDTLDASDWLGHGSTTYPLAGVTERGIDWLIPPGSGAERIFMTGTTFEITLEALPHMDQVRVITIPSPGVLSFAGVFLVLSRRRRTLSSTRGSPSSALGVRSG